MWMILIGSMESPAGCATPNFVVDEQIVHFYAPARQLISSSKITMRPFTSSTDPFVGNTR